MATLKTCLILVSLLAVEQVIALPQTRPFSNTSSPSPRIIPLQKRFTTNSQFGSTTCTKQGMYALTYDDGPDPTHTPIILAALAEFNVKATFFMLGTMIQANPLLAKTVFDQGHHIASHSFSHPVMTQLTIDQVRNEIDESETEIVNTIGVRPKYFRPPYGEINQAVYDELTSRGYTVVMWSIDTNYWVASVDAQQIVQTISDSVSSPTTQSHIALMHDIHEKSALVTPLVMGAIATAGFKQVPVFLCLDVVAYQT